MRTVTASTLSLTKPVTVFAVLSREAPLYPMQYGTVHLCARAMWGYGYAEA